MLAFYIPAESAYIRFDLWVLAIWGSIFIAHEPWQWQSPLRRPMLLMSSWGALGGVLISQLFRQDFWNPPSVLSFAIGPISVTLEDALYGFGFAGIMTALPFSGWRLEVEAFPLAHQGARRLRKIGQLFAVLLVGGAMYWFTDANSMGVTTITFTAGAVLLYWLRRNLLFLALWGGLVTPLVYGLIVSAFLLVAGNRVELASELCQFYRERGAWGTGFVLASFHVALGAFIVPLYAWITNQRFVNS